ncbi:MAG TPA: hypothetical protein VLA77_04905 [Candidatus Saccharimonadales bacterium]|nr:hypothetical protein [Candidatus Saccharimonadales bacterium]
MKLALPTQKQMQFAPIPNDDGDELSRSITDDPTTHDDNWNLHEEVDAVKLNRFLNEALQEIGPEVPENLYK